MVKTAPLSDNTHRLLKTAQKTLGERYGIDMPITNIIDNTLPLDSNKIVEAVVGRMKMKMNDVSIIENRSQNIKNGIHIL